eukprot:Gb_32225 [translate_table: standard]
MKLFGKYIEPQHKWLAGAGLLFLVATTYDVHRSIKYNERRPTKEEMAILEAHIKAARRSGVAIRIFASLYVVVGEARSMDVLGCSLLPAGGVGAQKLLLLGLQVSQFMHNMYVYCRRTLHNFFEIAYLPLQDFDLWECQWWQDKAKLSQDDGGNRTGYKK